MENTTEVTKSPTWADLKVFVNSLNEEQLLHPIRWWGEERGGKVTSISALPEDYISDGEGYSPKSSYDNETLADALEADEPIMVKGTPMLYMD